MCCKNDPNFLKQLKSTKTCTFWKWYRVTKYGLESWWGLDIVSEQHPRNLSDGIHVWVTKKDAIRCSEKQFVGGNSYTTPNETSAILLSCTCKKDQILEAGEWDFDTGLKTAVLSGCDFSDAEWEKAEKACAKMKKKCAKETAR